MKHSMNVIKNYLPDSWELHFFLVRFDKFLVGCSFSVYIKNSMNIIKKDAYQMVVSSIPFHLDLVAS